MHYLIGLLIAFGFFWALKRAVVRLFKHTPRPAMMTAVKGPKHKTARYVAIALLTFAIGWFFRASLYPEPESRKPSKIQPPATVFPEHQFPEPSAIQPTAIVFPEHQSLGPSKIQPLAAVTPNPETPRSSGSDCEWVNSFAREDGGYVKGHWSSKPGYAGECPLPEPAPLLEPTPSPPLHEPAPIHVGPRGGHYHYSKNGKKIYEPRR
jgi:hypothetical protein